MTRLALLLALLLLVPAHADDSEKLPSITYGARRESKRWITKPGTNTQVAVDDGITWDGVALYLSLMDDLIAVDVASGKPLWSTMVGAFWGKLSIARIQLAEGVTTAVVELRPGPGARRGVDLVQYHELKTGKVVTPVDAKAAAPLGAPLKPRAVWHGGQCALGTAFRLVVVDAAGWATLKAKMFAGQQVALGEIDFAKEVAVVVSAGDSFNCRGFSIAEAYEDDARLLIRAAAHTFQTMGGGARQRPWGIWVLPRRPKKAIVAHRNVQSYIAGPAIWHEWFRFAALPAPAAQLEALPAK